MTDPSKAQVRFQSLQPALSEASLTAIERFGFSSMTPVQAAAIPLFLHNKDVLVEATTGSGKTLAFGLPIVEILRRVSELNAIHYTQDSTDIMTEDHRETHRYYRKHDVGAVILAPTRELATQIFGVMEILCTAHNASSRNGDGWLRCVLCVGGSSVAEACAAYSQTGGQILIGTPGRLLDLKLKSDAMASSGSVTGTKGPNFKKLEVLVLDEADTILDLGFRDTINQILGFLPKQRRTGLFSATQTKELKELARAGLRNPVSISVRVQHEKRVGTALSDIGAGAGTEHDGDDSKSVIQNADQQQHRQAQPPPPPQQQQQQQQQQQATPSTLDNTYIVAPHDERPRQLARFLQLHPKEKVIVFCSTCACVDFYSMVFEKIAKLGISGRGLAEMGAEESGAVATQVGSAGHERKKDGGKDRKDGKVDSGVGSGEQTTVQESEKTSGIFPSSLLVVGFHGKMVPKKRTGLYRKFVSASAGVMFSTDVAARGVDIPDVDWIVQLAAPKDPAFFVHRVGRTARAGRRGGALLFLSEEELPYVALLRGRGVPLREQQLLLAPAHEALDTKHIHGGSGSGNDSGAVRANTQSETEVRAEDLLDRAGPKGDILEAMKEVACRDRDVLEAGTTAFMSFLRAYKENLCSYIFRADQLDIGAVARAYGLLRLPKIPETRQRNGAKPIVFEPTYVDTTKIPYLHKEKEKARLRRLKALKAALREEEEAMAPAAAGEMGGPLGAFGAGGGSVGGGRSVGGKSLSGKSLAGMSVLSRKSGKPWLDPAQYVQQRRQQEELEGRKRKKKTGVHKKIVDEWDELAAEEMAYKKFKRGHISKEEYDKCLTSDKKLQLDPLTGQPLTVTRHVGSSDDDDDDDDDVGGGSSDGDSDGDSDDDGVCAGSAEAGGRSVGGSNKGRSRGKCNGSDSDSGSGSDGGNEGEDDSDADSDAAVGASRSSAPRGNSALGFKTKSDRKTKTVFKFQDSSDDDDDDDVDDNDGKFSGRASRKNAEARKGKKGGNPPFPAAKNATKGFAMKKAAGSGGIDYRNKGKGKKVKFGR